MSEVRLVLHMHTWWLRHDRSQVGLIVKHRLLSQWPSSHYFILKELLTSFKFWEEAVYWIGLGLGKPIEALRAQNLRRPSFSESYKVHTIEEDTQRVITSAWPWEWVPPYILYSWYLTCLTLSPRHWCWEDGPLSLGREESHSPSEIGIGQSI